MRNTQVRLRSRPLAIPQASDFYLQTDVVPQLAAGQILVRNMFLSVDPAMRGWIVDVASYAEPVAIDAVMRAIAVGEVVGSTLPDFTVGEKLTGWFGWQEWAIATPGQIIRRVAEPDLPLSAALGITGLNGFTALLALEHIGNPKSAETVVISTAAGGVGSAAGQIAKIYGCRTIGLVGSAVKRDLCLDLFGYDAAIDYRSPHLSDAIRDVCPDGVNVYFDNTAGPISDAVLENIAIGARIIVCGTASISSWAPAPVGPIVQRQLLVRRARMEGFITFDHSAEFARAATTLASWIRSGLLTYREEILDGIDKCAGSIADLYSGSNLGKRVIRL